jgi:hypothetical protein
MAIRDMPRSAVHRKVAVTHRGGHSSQKGRNHVHQRTLWGLTVTYAPQRAGSHELRYN